VAGVEEGVGKEEGAQGVEGVYGMGAGLVGGEGEAVLED